MKKSIVFSVIAAILTAIYLLSFGSFSKPVAFEGSEYHLQSMISNNCYTDGVVLPKYIDVSVEMDVVPDQIDDDVSINRRVKVVLTNSDDPYKMLTAPKLVYYPLFGNPVDGVYHVSFRIERRLSTILYTGCDNGEESKTIKSSTPGSGKLYMYLGGYQAVISHLEVKSRHIAILSNLILPQIILGVTLLLWILAAIFAVIDGIKKYDPNRKLKLLFLIVPITVSFDVMMIQMTQLFTIRAVAYINDLFLAKTGFIGSSEVSGEVNKWIIGISLAVFIVFSAVWMIKNRSCGMKKAILSWGAFILLWSVIFLCSVMLMLIVLPPTVSLVVSIVTSSFLWTLIFNLPLSLASFDGFSSKSKNDNRKE